ncbi:CHAT domain-containing protein [Microcoleus sp. FACHB-68]|uniref:CHAT domain-containing protein n=1 Tax=Microcoleus sp. FACHB-68 TaxID=2692826 RepID=UPI00168445A6|nr:CHAT domain-containing protein [Microcoleus sp. FACHB-68]MBD1938465.1 CHAT domain-containing protein [Microcoleus sp. FACHB-68]
MKLNQFFRQKFFRFLLTALFAFLWVAGLPALAKVSQANSVNTYTQAFGGEEITRSRLDDARKLQADGRYRQACKTLLQALEIPDFNCNKLIDDEITPAETTQILKNVPVTSLRVAGLTNLGELLRVMGALKNSETVLKQTLEMSERVLIDPDFISAAYLSLGNTQRALGKRAEELIINLPNLEENLSIDSLRPENYYKVALKSYEKVINSSSNLTALQAKLNKLSLLVETNYELDLSDLWQEVQLAIDSLPLTSEKNYIRLDFAQSLICINLQEIGQEERQRIPTPHPPIMKLCQGKTQTEKSVLSNSVKPDWKYIGQLLYTAAQEAENLKDVKLQSYALGNLGELYEINQQWSIAKKLTEEALNLAQSIQAEEITYRLQWQLGRISRKIKEDNPEAIAAYTTAFNNLQSLRKDLSSLNRDVQFSFRDEVEPVYRELVDLLLQPETPKQESLILARDVIEGLQLAELDDFFRDACADAKPEQIDEIVNKSESKAAILYSIILENKLAVILKLPKQELRYYSTAVSQDKVEKDLENLLIKLKSSHLTEEDKELPAKVYDWLIREAEQDLQKAEVSALVFVLDGSLRNIPMAALYDRKTKQYLIKKNYNLALAPGLQLLSAQALTQKNLNVLAAGVSKGQIFNKSTPLPQVENELQKIQEQVPKQSQVLLNENFTEMTFQATIKSDPVSVVHIATHGKFSSDPNQTYIDVWGKSLKVKDLDSILRISDQKTSNKLELLILSACETAKGDKRATLGIAGVAVKAGARSTIASLWLVNDNSSAQLVEEFYKQLKANPKIAKAEALRKAQLKLMDDYPALQPMKWAPYILVGNWQ